MKALPVTVEPFAGETVGSVYRRLAERNAVPTGELWTTIRQTRPRLPLRTTPELVPRLVEELAELPPGYFDGRPRDRLFARCAHAQWKHANCATCAQLPAPVTMCRRCAHGQTVEVRTRCGAVCARHRRWHYAGADEDLTGSAAHLRAERCLVGTLWERGVGLDTGELELAAELITLRRSTEHRGAQPFTYPEQLREVYPEAVQLAALLTEPWAERFLSNIRVGRVPVAALVEAAVTARYANSRHGLAAISDSFSTHGREVVISLNRTVRLRYGRSPGLGAVGERILHIAPRVRATFLRHADARYPVAERAHGSSSPRAS
ncbi:hypothetical protein [Microbacterium aurum]